MSVMQTSAVVYALIAIANWDSTFWRGIWAVGALFCLLMAACEEDRRRKTRTVTVTTTAAPPAPTAGSTP